MVFIQDFPSGIYNIIYADPPWEYNDKSLHRGGALRHYRTMSLSEVCGLPVNSISASDSLLFLWATFPNIEKAFKVINAWGFTYKTIGFNWIKTNKNGSIYKGMGHYTRSNPEVCLLARKGKGLVRLDKSISSVVVAPRRKHSQKPDEVRNLIVRAFGDVNRIELFSRKSYVGWSCWGDDMDLVE